jgi:1-acyl-sn-glycerol-3-phosphate acyltransferases
MSIKNNPWMFYVGRFIFWLQFTTIGRCHVEGRENIPKEGGVIIAPNHISIWDPPVTGAMMKRPMKSMAKQELFDIPIFGFFMKRVNSFPVKRGVHDMSAMRNAFYLLENGNALLMFPEGTRSKDGKPGKARAGVGMVACNAQVPVIPVKIENTDKFFKLKKVKIKYGKPIMPPKEYSKSDYIEFSQKILNEIAVMEFEK